MVGGGFQHKFFKRTASKNFLGLVGSVGGDRD